MTESAEDRIAKLEARVGQLEAVIAGLRAVFGGGAAEVASDRELDGPHGDEKIRFDPRDWSGPPHKGRMMSRCEADFLDVYAETMLYFAGRNTDQRKAGFERKTAARAAGWAKRIRGGWQPPAAPPAPSFGNGAPAGFGASSWGSTTSRFGGPRMGDPPPPAAPASEPKFSPSEDDDSFDFGANVRPPAAPPPAPADDFDDDPPL